ncbi:hypothetical protein AB6A40_001707 [Gnathostoma spinigerum]|uniref:Uncharacterized protein n=1 Tax=Gnathostoma spinigerum TaxID=75299 RepID=A0ABD6EDS0_9BILA
MPKTPKNKDGTSNRRRTARRYDKEKQAGSGGKQLQLHPRTSDNARDGTHTALAAVPSSPRLDHEEKERRLYRGSQRKSGTRRKKNRRSEAKRNRDHQRKCKRPEIKEDPIEEIDLGHEYDNLVLNDKEDNEVHNANNEFFASDSVSDTLIKISGYVKFETTKTRLNDTDKR